MSTTKTAMSETEPPRLRSEAKEWWPGVSINSNPGDLNAFPPNIAAHVSLSTSAGTSVAPMCWVMPPASRSMTLA